MSNAGEQNKRAQRRSLTGVVGSISGAKGISVTISRLVKNALYGKYVRRRTKLAVHDPHNLAKVGDEVEIVPCRPVSKSKSWRLLRVTHAAEAASQGQTAAGG